MANGRTVVSTVRGLPPLLEEKVEVSRRPKTVPPLAVVIALNNLRHDSRVLKEAMSLGDAGFRSVRVGIVTSAADPPLEHTEAGLLMRVRTSSVPYFNTGDAPGANRRPSLRTLMLGACTHLQPLDDLRLFLGRIRENYRIYRSVTALKPDVVIACDLNALPSGVLCKLAHRVPLVYDVHEIWTEQVATSQLFRTIFNLLERCLLPFADQVMTVNPGLAHELRRRYGVDSAMVVYNGPTECRSSAPDPRQPLRLLFQGHLALDRRLPELVRSMTGLKGKAVLTIQGFGPALDELRKMVTEEGLQEVVTILDPCLPQDVIRDASHHDVGVINYRGTSTNLYLSTPVKLFDYLGAGLAIASSDLPEIGRLLAGADCAVFFDPEDPEEPGRTLLRLAEHPEEVRRMKEAGARLCPTISWDSQAKPFVQRVSQLAGRRRA